MPGEEEWCSERVRCLFLGFLFFLFRHFAQALLNSTPQLRARDRCAVARLGSGDF